MNITTKFNVGQTVYHIHKDRTTREIPCSICDGTKDIEYRGQTYRCPECSGSGYDFSSGPTYLHSVTIHSDPVKEVFVTVRDTVSIRYFMDVDCSAYALSWLDEAQAFGSLEDALATLTEEEKEVYFKGVSA